jgi:hypothetical protein
VQIAARCRLNVQLARIGPARAQNQIAPALVQPVFQIRGPLPPRQKIARQNQAPVFVRNNFGHRWLFTKTAKAFFLATFASWRETELNSYTLYFLKMSLRAAHCGRRSNLILP